ncbi:Cytochrome c-type biogenesis protein CcmE [uncultured archaeon]|nr:Cytochrome c-type biogenesis protein CcmE [uncultured archaeon]
MNKKQRLILGVSIVVVLLGYLVLTSGVVANQYEVSDAVAAKENLTGKIIVVNGTLVAGTDKYDQLSHTLTFKMTDGIETIDVIYTGEKIDIPPEYTNIQVIVTGQFNNSLFEAYKKPLTKCPSKYEASPDKIGQ